MGHGAEAAGIWIKYCMSLPRHILQSSQISAVNAARVSGDYMLSKVNVGTLWQFPWYNAVTFAGPMENRLV